MADNKDLDPFKQAFLEAFPNPNRNGCPDQQTLKAIARKQLPLNHPAQIHVSECSPCFREVLEYQTQWQRKHRQIRTGLAAVAVLLMVALLTWWWRVRFLNQPSYTNTELASAPLRTVNLWNVDTLRGDQSSNLSAVSLPASLVRVTIILPHFSELGQYNIAVTKDRSGRSVLAEGKGSAVATDSQAVVKVVLDLRKTKGGLYFLSTTREQDQASYYYPLQVAR